MAPKWILNSRNVNQVLDAHKSEIEQKLSALKSTEGKTPQQIEEDECLSASTRSPEPEATESDQAFLTSDGSESHYSRERLTGSNTPNMSETSTAINHPNAINNNAFTYVSDNSTIAE